ncbi:MAG: hypothetical protein AAGM38_13430 [Pseudomonadota bacterium]
MSESDSSGPGWGQIVGYIKRIMDKRSIERRRVFKDEIKYAFQVAERNHGVFLEILHEISLMAARVKRLGQAGQNDIDEFADLSETAIEAALRKRNIGRAERRQLYEMAILYKKGAVGLSNDKILAFSSDELKDIQGYFVSIKEYYESEAVGYKHEIKTLCMLLKDIIVEAGNSTIGIEFDNRIVDLEGRISEYESQIESDWADVGRCYERIRLKLRQA